MNKHISLCKNHKGYSLCLHSMIINTFLEVAFERHHLSPVVLNIVLLRVPSFCPHVPAGTREDETDEGLETVCSLLSLCSVCVEATSYTL